MDTSESSPAPVLPATQRCLNVPELQYLIFDIVSRQLGGPATLAVLARTARTFHEVALGILWSVQASLMPLVKCFPSQLWSETRYEDGTRIVTLQSEPKPEDWTRVKPYAARIRELRQRSLFVSTRRSEAKLSGATFVTLRNSLGSEPLLPHLHSFEWVQTLGDEAHDLASFLLMLNPHVSSMDVVMKKWSEQSASTIAGALGEFAQNPSQLRSVTFACPACPPIEEAVLALGYRQKHLQALVCTWESKMSPETITHLSSLNNLQQVSIKADQETTLQILGKAKEHSGTFFSSLRFLSLHTESLELCEDWLGAIRSSAIDSLAFVVDQPPTDAAFYAFLKRLVESRANEKLHKLRFVSKTPCPRGSPNHVIRASTLEPLLQLNLTALQLEPGSPFALDDEFVERVARAWPRLRTLELGAEWRRYTLPRVTLSGLLPLAQRCPDLATLGLAFNPDASEFQQRFEAGDRPLDGVSFGLWVPFVLGVGATAIDGDVDTFLFSGVLSDLCPGLRKVQTAWGRVGRASPEDVEAGWDQEEGGVSESWRQIDKFATEMARVRRQERLWTE